MSAGVEGGVVVLEGRHLPPLKLVSHPVFPLGPINLWAGEEMKV